MKAFLILATMFATTIPALAEPMGRWWSGFGQGTVEYGIKNDSAGSDKVYIACSPDRTYIAFTVGGVEPKKGSDIIVTIGADEFELFVGRDGYFETESHVAYDTFHALWAAMRRGTNMRVRLSTGQSTNFTLAGAAKVLGREPCETDFERPRPVR